MLVVVVLGIVGAVVVVAVVVVVLVVLVAVLALVDPCVISEATEVVGSGLRWSRLGSGITLSSSPSSG